LETSPPYTFSGYYDEDGVCTLCRCAFIDSTPEVAATGDSGGSSMDCEREKLLSLPSPITVLATPYVYDGCVSTTIGSKL